LPQVIKAQQVSHTLHRHDHQTLQTLLIVLLLISLNVISILDQTVCISLI